MAAFRYLQLDARVKALLKAFDDLLQLFNHLTLMFNGDADRALDSMKYLQQMGYIDKDVDLDRLRETLKEANLVQETPHGKLTLTKKGERFLRLSAFDEIFTHLRRGEFGEHRTSYAGEGGEKLPETRPYRFGDDLYNLDLNRSISNALKRANGFAADRSPTHGLQLAEQDLEVHETEHHSNCATVLLIDVSHSMVLYGEDRITPAKKVALALAELITTQYPKDSLDIVLFGDEAREIKIEDLPYLGAGPYHTNTKAALQLARRILMRKKHANKQIFMITDGKPSAIYEHGRLYVNPIGLDPRIVAQTLEEASICRRAKIIITTFMLTDHPALVDFVNKLTRINRGRAYFADCKDVAKTVFVDYIRNRRKKILL